MTDRLIVAYSLLAFMAACGIAILVYATRGRRAHRRANRRHQRLRREATRAAALAAGGQE